MLALRVSDDFITKSPEAESKLGISSPRIYSLSDLQAFEVGLVHLSNRLI